MRILILAVFIGMPAPGFAQGAATPQELQRLKHDYYLMEHYRLSYSEDIFDYCVRKNGTVATAAGSCMIRQDRLKTSTLNEAQEQLGRRSLAQAVYDDCLDYYPLNGVERIRECVRTRLELNSLLQDEDVEKTIYHLCDVKWRDHGYLSIDNCSSAQVRYFQRTGEFRD